MGVSPHPEEEGIPIWSLRSPSFPVAQSPARVSQSTDFNTSCRPELSPSRENRQVLLLAWEHFSIIICHHSRGTGEPWCISCFALKVPCFHLALKHYGDYSYFYLLHAIYDCHCGIRGHSPHFPPSSIQCSKAGYLCVTQYTVSNTMIFTLYN